MLFQVYMYRSPRSAIIGKAREGGYATCQTIFRAAGWETEGGLAWGRAD